MMCEIEFKFKKKLSKEEICNLINEIGLSKIATLNKIKYFY